MKGMQNAHLTKKSRNFLIERSLQASCSFLHDARLDEPISTAKMVLPCIAKGIA